jgi:hypothetical protein
MTASDEDGLEASHVSDGEAERQRALADVVAGIDLEKLPPRIRAKVAAARHNGGPVTDAAAVEGFMPAVLEEGGDDADR